MRSEQAIMDLILNTARDDERIRAVMMNGSRVSPVAKRDIFQDYDIVYFVTDVASFTNDHSWIDRFGEMMILQMPDAMGDPPPTTDGSFGYLMQFMDGNRIDLTLYPIAKLQEFEYESLTVILMDKDRLFKLLPAPSESTYLPKRPTAQAFADCCNEFWWVSPYVAKGLWREEIPYAKYMIDHAVRVELMKMLTWYVGIKTGFTSGPGKFGKYLQQCLEPAYWEMLEKSYSDASFEKTWESLHAMCDLFRIIATGVAEHFGFEYPYGDDERVSAHLKHVQALPRDAKEIY